MTQILKMLLLDSYSSLSPETDRGRVPRRDVLGDPAAGAARRDRAAQADPPLRRPRPHRVPGEGQAQA